MAAVPGLAMPSCRTEALPSGSFSARLLSHGSQPSQSARSIGAEHVNSNVGAADERLAQLGYQEIVVANGDTEGGVLPEHGEDLRARSLTLKIISARNLRNADQGFFSGKSDPYCVVHVAGKPDVKFKTQVIDNCLDPDWNYVVEIPGWIPGEALEFTVWDSDMWPKSDDFLGECTLPSVAFFPHGFRGELAVNDVDAKPGSDQAFLILEVQVEELAPLQFVQQPLVCSAQSSPSVETSRGLLLEGMGFAEGGSNPEALESNGYTTGGSYPVLEDDLRAWTLTLSIISARNLRDADSGWAGKSDPYCVVQLAGKPDVKIQTQVIDNCLDPDWNYVVQIPGWLPGEALEFSIWDKDVWPKSDDLIGRATLPSNAFFPHGFSGELQVYDEQAKPGSHRAFLILEVQAQEMVPSPLPQETVAPPTQISRAVTSSKGLLPEGAKCSMGQSRDLPTKAGSRGGTSIGGCNGRGYPANRAVSVDGGSSRPDAYSEVGLTDAEVVLCRNMTAADALRLREKGDLEQLRREQRERREQCREAKRSAENQQRLARRALAAEKRDALEKSLEEQRLRKILATEERQEQAAARKAKGDAQTDVPRVQRGLSRRMTETMYAKGESFKSSQSISSRSPRSPKAELQFRSPAASWGLHHLYLDRQDGNQIDLYMTKANSERELQILQAKELKEQDRLRRQKAEEVVKAQQQAHIAEIRQENEERRNQELMRRQRDRDILWEQRQRIQPPARQGLVQSRSVGSSVFVESRLLSKKAEVEAKNRPMRPMGEEERLMRQAEHLRERDRLLAEKKEKLARVKRDAQEQQVREAHQRRHESEISRLSVQTDVQQHAAEDDMQQPGEFLEEVELPIQTVKEPYRSVLVTTSLEAVLAERQRRQVLGVE
eukprot:TRINITY_DN678_c0_g1_i1.p1 TRINITY_DN678_c0_g1~~TRINITY_DN678_c0_g1_i1.p1  ORF type:complete len:922 (-),score=173.11 TRINITY_DN678_c0_g1_i1:78-2741(-)